METKRNLDPWRQRKLISIIYEKVFKSLKKIQNWFKDGLYILENKIYNKKQRLQDYENWYQNMQKQVTSQSLQYDPTFQENKH